VGSWTVTRRGLLLAAAGTGLLAAWPATVRASAGPEIVDCAGWGARPNSRIVTVVPQRPVRIMVHHTATPNVDDLSRAAADRLARGIQDFHMDVRGWLDSGQHFTISRGGVLLEGRHRSLEVLRAGRQQVEGAHCTGQNVVALGIENEGTYVDVDPPAPLWARLRETCAHACAQYGIAPGEIYGHRDFRNTICPGDRLHAMLPQLRREVADLLGAPLASDRRASWPLLRLGDRGPEVAAAQHLLRGAGIPGVPTTGAFDGPTDAAVRRFQAATGAEERNGLLGGESWPVLARPVRRGAPTGAGRAVEVLAAARRTEAVPDLVRAPDWQRLLGTGGPPADTTVDPIGPPR
jgi:hypothetical protein